MFAVRVCAAATAFLVYALLTLETIHRAKARRFDLAFLLALSCSGIALGMFASQSWGAAYYLTTLRGEPAYWMLDSGVVLGYTAIILTSALALMHSLTLSGKRSAFYFFVVAACGAAGYLYSGGML